MSIVSRRVVSAAARSVLVGGLLVGAGRVARAARGVPLAVGASDAVLRARAASSPHSRDGRFGNTEPGVQIAPGELRGLLLRVLTRGTTGTPSAPVPTAADVQPATAGELALTWYGHSSVLLEIDGRRVLTDPVWSERVSPSERVGPRRLHPAPVPLQALPPVDAVVVSHDHYDHLDMATVRRLGHETAAVFVVPVGIGAHLRRWGVPDDRIRELDGTTPPRSPGSRSRARRRVTSPAGCSPATRPSGRRGRSRGHGGGPTSAATPVTPRHSPRRARGWDRSTSPSCPSGPTTSRGPTST
ncbi:hypothetical protein GCM10023403_00300 [Pseudonocardia benzenivorans]